MSRSIKNRKQWFLVIFLFAMLFVTSQVLAKQTSAQTATAVVKTGALNVRSGPSVAYGVVTVVNQGNVLTLLGRTADSTWAYVQTASSHIGWVNASSDYITPSVAINTLPVVTPTTTTPTATTTAVPTGTSTPTSTPTTTPAPTATAVPVTGAAATVVTGALNVRSGPGISYGSVAVVNQGTVVSLLGRNSNSSWAKIRLANGTEGWVNASSTYITPNVAISSLPVLTATAPGVTASALVATGALNVRSGPGVTYSVLTVASQGQTVALLGRNANSSWAKIRAANGTEGWVNASLITPNVSISSLPLADSPAAPEPPVPVAPGAVLSLRSGPGFSYPVTGSVYQGLQVTAIGRNANNTWLKVRLSDGQEGWIGAQYVQLSIPVGNLPVLDGTAGSTTPPAGTTPTPPATTYWATVNTGAANVRSGPGIGYGIVTVVTQGQYVSLLARNSVSSWAKVQLTNGTVGWINASLLNANIAINSLPVEDVQTISTSGVVNTAALNVRTGPGLTYGVTAVVYQGQGVALIGRNADSSWVKVRLTNGTVGWVNSAYIQTSTTLNSLPITN
ncbi:MAG: SH3 domain-containing protein [Ardenticatenaceae bacterium]|nr:SH3 domain-containing protein [Anaerolineales bacterium]MCB9009861.1 SH3 domain-containing protein [Ardenticatenaceae bacterium]